MRTWRTGPTTDSDSSLTLTKLRAARGKLSRLDAVGQKDETSNPETLLTAPLSGFTPSSGHRHLWSPLLGGTCPPDQSVFWALWPASSFLEQPVSLRPPLRASLL